MRDRHRSRDTIRIDPRDAEPCDHALFLATDSGIRIVPLPTSGTVVVGRGADADVQVADEAVSRRHLCIHIGAPFQIEDLRSTNGTAVGAHWLLPREPRALAPGEAITAGTTTLMIRGRTSQRPTSVADAPRVEPLASDSLRPVLALADRAATSMISVLLLGETGAGKDVLAERIHRASPRASGPFLRLNCAAFSPTLLASELFGHEKGAFTGATSPQPGLLQSASGGTVFLDEVGDLPMELQAKLLLVLERREVLPVGAVRPRPLDVRFISATNRDLPKEVDAGAFRRDLYFRLNGITIEVPPLRTRVSEIDGLARLFACEVARSLACETPALSSEALAALRAYAWPGNIRELRAVIERAVLLSSDGVVRPHDLTLEAIPAAIPPSAAAASSVTHALNGDRDDLAERQQIAQALAQCGGNQSRAARLLGMSRNTLIARIEKYGLARPWSPRSPS
jgi:transcriptional regulator with PAS, ATPase and Fis domain